MTEYMRCTALRPGMVVKVTGDGETKKTFSGEVVSSAEVPSLVGKVRTDWLRFAFVEAKSPEL